MQEQHQSQGPHLGELEAAFVAANETQAVAESNVQSITASESALHGENGQITRCVKEREVELSKMRQKNHHKVKDVLFGLDGLQVHLTSTGLSIRGLVAN